MPTLNLGVLAHVDAGKTTLTERLLFETGSTDHLGRVDHGDTTTDADALERRRGITIRSAVATLTLPSTQPSADGDLKVNLIDTPGHSDFVAEVERALVVLDGAILVVSAVEGVQAQTRVLIRVLERLGLPFLVFANKIDRAGADPAGTLAALREVLTGAPVALTEPTGTGSRGAQVRPRSGQRFLDDLVDALSPHDERLLRRYVDADPSPTEAEALAALARHARRGRVHPVVFGAALTGVGIRDVLDAVATYLPTAGDRADGPLHAAVFKIDRDPDGHRVAFVRLHEGTLGPRDHVRLHHRTPSGTVETREARAVDVRTFEHGAETERRPARAGDIATVLGLGAVAIGDQLGRWDAASSGRHFPAPGLESVVEVDDPRSRPALFAALQELSEQDPLIDARLDGPDDEVTVDVYGEVQQEVLGARLQRDYGVEARFLPTRVVHVERVAGTGEGHQQSAMGNASLGLRVEAAPPASGIGYALGEGVERGYLLPSFHVAIEETLAREVAEGLYGWRLADATVRVVHARFSAPTPSAGEFRALTTATFRHALRQAGTVVCAPVSRFELELPVASLTAVLARLVAAGAAPEPVEVGTVRCRLTGTIPTGELWGVERRLPDLTSGRGVLFSEPAGHTPVVGTPPARRRSQPAPGGAK